MTYTQYTFAAVTAAVTIFIAIYSICIKKFDHQTVAKADEIIDKAAHSTNKYKCIIFIPLLFMVFVIAWWLIFAYLFFTITTFYSDSQELDIGVYTYNIFDNYRLWFVFVYLCVAASFLHTLHQNTYKMDKQIYTFRFHIFMGIYVLNSIYVFACLMIARIICITSKLPSGSNGDAIEDIDIELRVLTDGSKRKESVASKSSKRSRIRTKSDVSTMSTVTIVNYDANDRYHSRRCLWPIIYSTQEILSRFIGSIGIESIIFIYIPYLVKLEKVFRILGKLLMKLGSCLNLRSCREGKKEKKKCPICNKLCCNKCCLFMVENGLLFRCLFRGLGCCFANTAKCFRYCCLSELVSINTMSVQGLLSKNMVSSYKISENIRLNEDELEDAVDQQVDWALYVSEIWIPLFTTALCLLLIQINIFDIKDQLTSSVMPALVSLLIGIVIGNLYMAVFRFSAHLIFMEKMNLKKMLAMDKDIKKIKCCCCC